MADRLQKIMAHAGFGSRRSCEELISAGRVTVNGKVAKLGESAEPSIDTVEVDGEAIKFEKKMYIMLNKPKGVLSSTEDMPKPDKMGVIPQTVRDLVEVDGHLYPVGRLDKPSEGLILLTNDGDLAHKLTHPRYGHTKTYRAWVERKPSKETLHKWRNGVMLDDKKTAPAEVKILEDTKYVSVLKIVLREGRKRQIRKVASLLGHPVRRLVREKIGPLTLSGVAPGEWRHLRPGEVRALKESVKRSELNQRKGGNRGGKKRRPNSKGVNQRFENKNQSRNKRGRNDRYK